MNKIMFRCCECKLYLEDVVVGREFLGADVDVNVAIGRVQKIPCKLLNLLGPGGGPHENLQEDKIVKLY